MFKVVDREIFFIGNWRKRHTIVHRGSPSWKQEENETKWKIRFANRSKCRTQLTAIKYSNLMMMCGAQLIVDANFIVSKLLDATVCADWFSSESIKSITFTG